MAGAGRIFVSHSHHDNAWCREFVGALQAAGQDVWYDETGLGAGAEWLATVQRELQARDVFVVIVSPDAWDSRWVREELDLALATNRHILPVLHKPTTVDGFLLLRQWIWAQDLPGAEAARKVAEALGTPRADATAPAMPVIASPRAPQPQPARPTLPPLDPAPAPNGATPANHLTPARLMTLGFRAYSQDGIEFLLPPVCPVPGGVFQMGSDKARDNSAEDNETPQHPTKVGDFSIGQHPVTVAEYACAVRANAVREPPAGLLNLVPWAEQLERLDHPVVGLSWYDALAYARWLVKASGQPWRLPTEAEWEKAARGTDGRIYPWGDTFDMARCNTSAGRLKGRLGGTTPVGSYPSGASPYGAQDMAGNIWEWTSSLLKSYPYTINDGREDVNSGENRVLRGGSWSRSSRSARAACRNNGTPGSFLDGIGFRLVLGVSPGAQ